jgi:hypothetical protein
MLVPPGIFAGLGTLLLTGALVCACTTAGTPVVQQTTSSATAGAPAPSVDNSAPTVTPTPESDEDQVRDAVMAIQDAYNTQNWDAYLQLLCNPMRELFTGPVMDMVKKGRADQGLTQVISVKVKIDGDKATATMDAHNAVMGRQSVDLPMVREDGWKLCKLA